MALQYLLVLLNLIVIFESAVGSVTVRVNGENVYSINYKDMQYFMFIEDKEATISCTVQGTNDAPLISFLKEGNPLNTVLPASLYKLEKSSDGQSHVVKLKIDSSGFTNIVGNWTCDPGAGVAAPVQFKTMLTSKPHISFSPALVQGVARMGTTITLSCSCDSLEELSEGRQWNWFIDNATPAGSKIKYEGPGAETGYPTSQLVISDLDELDSAGYRCVCIVPPNIQFTSNEVEMVVMSPPGVPKNITMEQATMNTMTITWSNSNDMGVVLGYQISYKESESSAYREVQTGAARRYTLEGLGPLTNYNIKIAASNNAGSGSYSETVTFTTAQPRESKPVITKPRQFVYDEEDNMYLIDAGVGVNIPLTCQVNSYPASIVEWYLNDALLATEPSSDLPQNYGRTVRTLSQFEQENVLIVKATRVENSGRYTCTASNNKGREKLTFKLRVKDENAIDEKDGEEKQEPVASATSSSFSYILYLVSVTIILVNQYHTNL